MANDDLLREHVVRPAAPWRLPEHYVTECGRPTVGRTDVLTRDQFAAKRKKLGKQRAAFTTCMSCWHTAERWTDARFEADPVAVIARETYGQKLTTGEGREVFAEELRALATLVEAHREEYEQLRAGMEEAELIDMARRRRRAAGGRRG